MYIHIYIYIYNASATARKCTRSTRRAVACGVLPRRLGLYVCMATSGLRRPELSCYQLSMECNSNNGLR